MSLTIAVPREIFAGEKRVATVPDVVGELVKLGFAVRVEAGDRRRACIEEDERAVGGDALEAGIRGAFGRRCGALRARQHLVDGARILDVGILEQR